MDITVNKAQGLPEKAYISIRAGEVRKQVQYKPGEKLHFDMKTSPRTFMVDVFEKLGTTQVSLLDLSDVALTKTEEGPGLWKTVEITSRRGMPMTLDMHVNVASDEVIPALSLKPDRRQARHQAAVEAKNYLDLQGVQKLLQNMIHELLHQKPEDATTFMIGHLQDHKSRRGAHEQPTTPTPAAARTDIEDDLPDWSAVPGLGSADVPGFAPDGSTLLPKLDKHHSLVAKLLHEDALLYPRLQDIRTAAGVSLARCIKPGIDNRGHELIRTLGLVAGDEHCFEVFRDVFEPVISQWHGGYTPDSVHPLACGECVSSVPLESSAGAHVFSVQARCSRNLSGLPLLPAASKQELQEVERLISNAMRKLRGDNTKGTYHSLKGSMSYAPQPGGMSDDVEQELKASGLIFSEPDSQAQLSSGVGRNWPEARGIFISEGKDLVAWVNEQDHLKVICRQQGPDLQGVFQLLRDFLNDLEAQLQPLGHSFMRSSHLGFLTTCPSNLGTAMQVGAAIRIPLLTSGDLNFKQFCKSLGLSTCLSRQSQADLEATPRDRLWEVSVCSRLGCSEISEVNKFMEGCRKLIDMETRLESGEDINLSDQFPKRPVSTARRKSNENGKSELNVPRLDALVANSDQQERTGEVVDQEGACAGIGNNEGDFPDGECPEEMPDFSRSFSIAADVLREEPEIYAKLRTARTPGGVSFWRCINTCFENGGHPMIKTIGAVAGDEFCYSTFHDLFDAIIKRRHPNFDAGQWHHNEMDWRGVSHVPISSSGQNSVHGVWVHCSRNLGAFRMEPACSADERLEVEATLVKALESLTGEFCGEYFPLLGSCSYQPKPGGMSREEEELLDEKGLLFEEPDSQVLLSSGFGRHWPSGRGVFAARGDGPDGSSFSAWINESDHLRISVRQTGADLRTAFERMCRLHGALEAALENTGRRFAHDDRLGFLGTCPAQIGTCMTAGATLKLPFLSSRSEFRSFARHLKLQVHLSTGLNAGLDRVWEVSNLERIGSTEAQQIDAVVEGCKLLLTLEARLERGEDVALDIPSDALPSRAQSPEEAWFADIPGLGDDEYPGFPADACPSELPDLEEHSSIAAHVLKEDGAVYASLKELRTTFGTSLARCIKPAMDNKGHPLLKTIGAVAGDAECYELFDSLFAPIIRQCHPSWQPNSVGGGSGLAALETGDVKPLALDCSGAYVTSVLVCVRRNLSKFQMPPAISFEERREAERLVVDALASLGGHLQGTYLPLAGSSSFPSKPWGMSPEDEDELANDGILFEEPDAAVALSSGAGKNWPDARGVYVSHNRSLAAWVNEKDHLRLISRLPSSDLGAAFHLLCSAEAALIDLLKERAHTFAWNERLGFLTSCPSNLGTGFSAEVHVRLPLLSEQSGFQGLCQRLGVRAAVATTPLDVFIISNEERLGSSAFAQVNKVAEAVRELVALEVRLTEGQNIDLLSIPKATTAVSEKKREGTNEPTGKATASGTVQKPDVAAVAATFGGSSSSRTAATTHVRKKDVRTAQETLRRANESGRLLAVLQSMVQEEASTDEDDALLLETLSDMPGLGDAEAPGFPIDRCPAQMPDLSKHHCVAAKVLRETPHIYQQLKELKTPGGVSFAKCVKPAMDCRGHPMIRTVGAFAGDSDCYETFREFFDPVISGRLGGFPANGAALDAQVVSEEPLDPTGKYALWARVGTSRNLNSAAFPPAISRQDRLRVESLAREAMDGLVGDLKGSYLPLGAPSSNKGGGWRQLQGISGAEEEQLRARGFVFQHPDSTLMLSAGIGRHWPEGRGVFVNAERTFAILVNEEDHLQFRTAVLGGGLQQAFRCVSSAHDAVRQALQQQGSDYASSARLGFLTSCPSKVCAGGFHAAVLLRLPLLQASEDAKEVYHKHGARRVRTDPWGDTVLVSQEHTGSITEAELINQMLSKCRQLIDTEVKLEAKGVTG